MGISLTEFQKMIEGASPELLASPGLATVGIQPKNQKLRISEPKQDNNEPQFDSDIEREFWSTWNILGLPKLTPQYKFAEDRKFLVDFYHEPSMTGIEINGGTQNFPEKINGQWYIKVSGHNSTKGLHRDAEKSILAAKLGIHILAVPTSLLSKELICETMSNLNFAIKFREARIFRPQ